MNVEIIDFTLPDSSRKNLFITNIPASIHADDVEVKLYEIFTEYGLVYGVQVYPTQWKTNTETDSTEVVNSGYYAFVTFYSSLAATRAKDFLNGKIQLANTECKVAFAKRKKDNVEKKALYFTRCYELVGFYLGFNSWSTSIKTLFADDDDDSGTASGDIGSVKYVCMIELRVTDLTTDGIGVWQEAFNKKDPMSKIQAHCKCKKLCHQRAVENAFSKVLLVVLGNGKVTVEIDTTKPEFRVDRISDEQVVKINELDDHPDIEEEESAVAMVTDSVNTSKLSASNMDDINMHILQELEDEM